MRTKLRGKISLLFLTIAVLLAIPAMASALTTDTSGTTSLSPTIQSDKADYAPGELVTLTGGNWQPGESVHINVNDDEGQTWSRNVDVTADASGNISDSFNLPDWFVATYKVTATGAQSGVATTSFTDGNVRASADLSGSDKWTLTAIKYTTTDCSGTGVPFNSQTLTGTGKSSNLAANDGESVRLTASATSTSGKVFTNWTSTNAFTDLGNREICVAGFKNGTQEYVAHYVVNQAPVANNDSLTTNEDTAGNVNVLTNDTDANNDALTVTNNTNGANGSASCTTAGVCTYTPSNNFNGSDSFTYTVSDGKGGTATGTVNVTVNSVNDVPSFTKGANETVNEDSGAHSVIGWATAISSGPANESSQTLDFIVSNNNNSLFTATGQPQVSANGTLSYTLAADASGTATVDVKLHDNGGIANGGVDTSASQSFTITVTAVNDAPDAVNDSATTNEDTATNINVLGNDTDVDNTNAQLSVSSFTQPTHGTVSENTDGTLNYNPAANYNGSDSFTYTVSDGNGGTDTATVNLTVTAVNDAPDAVNDSYSVNEDGTLTKDAATGVLSNDTDVDGDSLTVTANTSPAHGSVTLNANGSFTYTPAANYNGSDSFTYTVSDGNGGTDTATVNLTVTAVNDAPDAVNDSATTDEDTATNINVLGNDADVDGDSLSVSSVGSANHGTVTNNNDGTITYTPNANYNGSDSFTYTVSDGNGGTDTATVNLTVTAVNDAPVADDQSVTTDEDTSKDVTLSGSDVDGDALTYTIVSGPNHGTLTGTGATRTYTPAADYNGPDSFTFKANDGTTDSNTATVSITVNAVNDAPVAEDDTKTTAEDTPLTFPSSDLVSNDDEGAADESAQTLTVTNVYNGTHGTVVLQAGNITFTPEANFSGPATFTYKVCDNGNPSECSVKTATVNVTVIAVNDAPEATDDSATTAEDTPKSINVLSNDTDVDGDSLSVSGVGAASHGTATNNNDGTITYTPNANYNGSDSFTYTVSDGNGGTDTATVNLTITAVNDAPVAAADTDTTTEDTPKSVNVLSNDTDVDGDSLSVSGVGAASHGTATNNNDGTITYTPNANYNGSDSFTYVVSDGKGGTAQGTVSITVSPVNDAPTVTLSGAATASEGETKTYNFAVSDPDSGDTFTLKSGFPDCGTGGDLVAGSLTTTASGGSFDCRFPDGSATPTVKIKVTDGGQADSNEATQSVTVANVNPTIGTLTTTGSGTACIGSTNVVKLSFSITDPGVDTHSGTINWGDGTTTQFNGSSVTDAQHSYSAGTYTITVNASDSDGGNAAPQSTTGSNQQVSLLYKVSDLQDPVNPRGATMSVFKYGSTVPMRVLITDCNNQPVNGLVPKISFTKVNSATPAIGVNEGLSTQPNDTNFLMRDAGNGQYIYNLNTKTLPDGDATYNATITDSKATQTAPATYGPKVSQNFGLRSK